MADDLKTVIENAPYPAALGVRIESLTADACRMVLPYKDGNSNPGKALHGGVAASMINLGGLAVSREALGEAMAPFHTCAIQVNYLAAAIGEAIVIEATLLRRGKELCFVDTAVRTEEGKPIARGLSTVRGRSGAEEPEPLTVQRDDGASDPGPMGPHLGKRVPFINRLGLEVEHMAGGRSRIAMNFKEENTDEEGGVHEGPLLALFDTTGAMAAWSVTGPGAFKASTVGIQAQIVTARRTGDLVAYGRMVHRDREIFWCDVEVAQRADGRAVARGSVLYRIVVPDKD